MPLTKVPGTSIVDDAITSAKITDATIVSADIANTTITSGNMALDPRNATNLSSGSVPLAQLGLAPAYDDAALLNDIATLALHSAIQNNQAAYNLVNAFVDQYEDSSGLDVLTNCQRTGEYMSSVQGGGNDSNTLLLLASNTTNGSTTFTDTSVGGSTHSISRGGSTVHSTTQKKFGTSSIYIDGHDDNLNTSADSDFDFGTGDFTIDAWIYPNGNQQYGTILAAMDSGQQSTSWNFGYSNTVNEFSMWGEGDSTFSGNDGSAVALSTWTHIAFVKYGTNATQYINGVSSITATPVTTWNTTGTTAYIGPRYSNHLGTAAYYLDAYLDEIRMSDVARWTANFTPPTAAYSAPSLGAAGNYTSTTETALATVSKMSIVVLYKNTYGTATLDTDLVAQVSSNGGTNYTSAPLTAAGTFSTGILMAKSNDITISNTGTAHKYKISFANQAASSKETRVEGVALLY